MQYILTQAEIDALTPVKRLQRRNEALEVARNMILFESGFKCGDYCDLCPISNIGGDLDGTLRPVNDVSRHICIKARNYSK